RTTGVRSMTDRARELVERARRYRKDNLRETSIGYALFGELADFIEQSLTPPEGDTVSDEVEQVARAFSPEFWGSIDHKRARAKCYRETPFAEAGFESAEAAETLASLCDMEADAMAENQLFRARAAIAALQSRISPQAGMREALVDCVATLAAVRATAAGDDWANSAAHFSEVCLTSIKTANAALSASRMSEDAK
ncbi:MAG TPA: hypothetical protein VFK15_07225, partial [Burkholderiales bacterium]|nr:hypothetical protein [Burkholderiales bacterium]